MRVIPGQLVSVKLKPVFRTDTVGNINIHIETVIKHILGMLRDCQEA